MKAIVEYEVHIEAKVYRNGSNGRQLDKKLANDKRYMRVGFGGTIDGSYNIYKRRITDDELVSKIMGVINDD